MKRTLLTLLAAAVMVPLTACADKIIDVSKLPRPAQNFIREHFSDAKISIVSVDPDPTEKTYEVLFTDGRSIEFDRRGEWKSVDCERTPVPAGIIPGPIRDHVAANHPDNFVDEISRDWRGYEVSLNNGPELDFNTEFVLVRYDD